MKYIWYLISRLIQTIISAIFWVILNILSLLWEFKIAISVDDYKETFLDIWSDDDDDDDYFGY
jgi:hypothetical protein